MNLSSPPLLSGLAPDTDMAASTPRKGAFRMNPPASIVIPSCSREKLVAGTLRSALGQGSESEVVDDDDGRPDDAGRAGLAAGRRDLFGRLLRRPKAKRG
jgi:hypothetical protein